MAWQWSRYSHYYPFFERGRVPSPSGMINERCFIRKEHKCGKMYGASKSCFIACPSDDDLDPMLALMSEKLSKLGIEPSIAIKERAYGQDIFCTKICGKIIESQFCMVILDDSIKDGISIPNPNVYYEYGLMTSLRKHIIPLQKEKLKLAFNIQSHDTIKYNPRNLATELERGIRDAIKHSEARDAEKPIGTPSERNILRKMELAGFEAKDEKWFLAEIIADTAFKGYGNHRKGFYVYAGKIDAQEDVQTYLDDLDIVMFRTENKLGAMQEELESKIKDLASLKKTLPQNDPARYEYRRMADHIGEIESRISELKHWIEMMDPFYLAFFVLSDQDMSEFMKLNEKKVELYPRFKTIYSQSGKMQFKDVCVEFGEGQRR